MAPIRVLVVDDSVVIRRLVSDVLSADPDVEVVGTAVNGRLALHKLEQLQPDLVTMDVEMPEMDGVEAVRQIRAGGSRVPVIMFSTLTERGATATLDALAAGASDYVTKPANMGSVSLSIEQVRTSLIPRIKALVPRAPSVPSSLAGRVAARPVQKVVQIRPRTSSRPRLLVIGSSTGGPDAVTLLLNALPRLDVPVAIVQHMPPVFTRQLAARLDRQVPYEVREAEHGVVMQPGVVHVAPGDHHLRVALRNDRLVTALAQDAPVNYCRPAVDVLFRSAVEAVGGGVLAVVLTGMGSDGCKGAEHIVHAGGAVLAQDQETSVVWGMPGAVATAGLAEEVLPLAEIGPAVLRRVEVAPAPSLRPNVLGPLGGTR